jgi:hypothetical protein
MEALLIVAFLAGIVMLQIFLSKGENKWLGLILPVISVIYSLMAVLGMAIYANQTTVERITQDIFVFLLLNIPTAILIAIYFACREKYKKKKEIDKMNIQDLN